jgi:hypothetical protein
MQGYSSFLSFPRRREFIKVDQDQSGWIPACAGMTDDVTR